MISCGGGHCGASTENGNLYTWGMNHYGQLGVGDTINRFKPTKVLFFSQSRIANFDLGVIHSALITIDGHLYTWGCNDCGQLGTGNSVKQQIYPKLNKTLLGWLNHKCALFSDR